MVKKKELEEEEEWDIYATNAGFYNLKIIEINLGLVATQSMKNNRFWG